MITFSHDVILEGRPLAAGTYTLLTIPGRPEWTVVFNRIPWQFGVFAYDPAFDALRVTVPARPADKREWCGRAHGPGSGSGDAPLGQDCRPDPRGSGRAVVTWRRAWRRGLNAVTAPSSPASASDR
jgi:Protein of unknown function (DUF2911)